MNYLRNIKKNTAVFFMAVLIAQFFSSTSQASYFRFWRGAKLESIDRATFQNRLNETLLPATGSLFSQNSGLLSYQPYLFSTKNEEAYGLPSEIALLEYSDEATYLSYRATAAGKAYGDLHWLLFEKSKSGSLVPGPYQGILAINQAYAVIASQNIRWNQGITDLRVYYKDSRFSEADYLSSIKNHIEFTNSFQPLAYFVLVDANYVLEYVQWPNEDVRIAASKTAGEEYDAKAQQWRTVVYDSLAEITAYPLVQSPFHNGRTLQEGEGIRYQR